VAKKKKLLLHLLLKLLLLPLLLLPLLLLKHLLHLPLLLLTLLLHLPLLLLTLLLHLLLPLPSNSGFKSKKTGLLAGFFSPSFQSIWRQANPVSCSAIPTHSAAQFKT